MDENTAQLELEKSQKLLKAIFEGITDPMIVLDRKMNLKLVNNAAIKYFGISPRTSLDNIPCYKALMGKDKVCSDCRIKDALFKQENLCYERDGFINPDRREQITLCPAVDHGSGSTYASIRINDITDFREIETELTHADKMISLGMLLSGMAHEINNPTNYILLNSQLLLKSWKSIFPILETYFKNNGEFSVAGLPYGEMRIEIPDLLSGIEQSAKRIKQIIIDLKTFSRKDDLKANEYINVNEAIEDSVRLTQKLIHKSTNSFQIHLDTTLPLIKVNRQGITQVMINLIENACQALEEPSQGISIVSMLSPDKNSLIIEVKDNGTGIPDHIISRIMEPFFTTRHSSGGTGLGLSTSLNIVRSHGGTIKVNCENKVNCEKEHGTSFKVLLPLVSRQKPIKVLIADDDPASRSVLLKMLENSGQFRFKEAASGAEVLFQIGQEKPDILLLDIHMPDVDGSEVCRVIKNTPVLSSVHVIVVTGLINSVVTEKIFAMGYEMLLEKPVTRQELLKTIHKALEEQL